MRLQPPASIAARLPHYEQRPQQLAMAEAVAEALRERRHLIVEAGTGVGKTFAYLVPAILAASQGEGEEKPAVRRIIVRSKSDRPDVAVPPT